MADVPIHHKGLGVTVFVPEEAADGWNAQGWRRASKAQAEEAIANPPPISEEGV